MKKWYGVAYQIEKEYGIKHLPLSLFVFGLTIVSELLKI